MAWHLIGLKSAAPSTSFKQDHVSSCRYATSTRDTIDMKLAEGCGLPLAKRSANTLTKVMLVGLALEIMSSEVSRFPCKTAGNCI